MRCCAILLPTAAFLQAWLQNSHPRPVSQSTKLRFERRSCVKRVDVCIIGGGLLGCLIARELSKHPVTCLLAEKREDLCLGMTKANSALLYPGYDHRPGTRKSRFALEGNRRTADLCEELGVPLIRCGSLLIVRGDAGRKVLLDKYHQGQESGVPDLEILGKKEILELEPKAVSDVTYALFSPNTAVLYPWRLGMAAARQAEKAGIELRTRTQIIRIRKERQSFENEGVIREGYLLNTADGEVFFASCVINAAGVLAHQVRELIFPPRIRIRTSMADYLVFGKEENPGLSHVIFYEPEDGGKGLTLVPQPNGTILAGATRRELPERNAAGKSKQEAAVGSTAAGGSEQAAVIGSTAFGDSEQATAAIGLEYLRNRIREVYPVLSETIPIRCFAGLRPEPYEVVRNAAGVFVDSGRSIHSFIIEQEPSEDTFINLLGIKTPGITASVPIAEYTAGLALESLRKKRRTVVEYAGHEAGLPPGRSQDFPSDGSQKNLQDFPSGGSRNNLRDVPDDLVKQHHTQDVPDDLVKKHHTQDVPDDLVKQHHTQDVPVDLTKHRSQMGYTGTAQGCLDKSVIDLPFPEKAALALRNSSYGRIICCCERVTEGEILNAIISGARTVDGVKLRCGAGMGKCQGSRCSRKIEEILSEWQNRAGMENETNLQEQVCPGEQANVHEITCDILIIGAGTAGMSLGAELKSVDPSRDILLVDREALPGGILTQCLHDGFQDPKAGRMISGPQLRDILWERVNRSGVRCLLDTHVTSIVEEAGNSIDLVIRTVGIGERERHHFPVCAEAASHGKWIRIYAKQAVLACGAIERTAGMLSITGSRPLGVYTAGQVQRMLNLENRIPGKRAVLAGAGNMGLILADLMIRKGIEVIRILEQEDHVTASPYNVQKYLTGSSSRIPMERIQLQSRVETLHGLPRLEGITVRRDVQKAERIGLLRSSFRLEEGPVSDYGMGSAFGQESVLEFKLPSGSEFQCGDKFRSNSETQCGDKFRSNSETQSENQPKNRSKIQTGTKSLSKFQSEFEYVPCDLLVLAAGLIPDRQLFPEVRGEHITAIGNCRRIYSTVQAIQYSARQAVRNLDKGISEPG